MRALPITVTCACGASGPLSAVSPAVAGPAVTSTAARPPDWSCPSCGQAYRTDGLDPSAVSRQLAVAKRYAWAGVPAVLVICGALAFVRPTVLFAIPVLLGAYYAVILPRSRRKLRDVYASLPEWRVSPLGAPPRDARPQ